MNSLHVNAGRLACLIAAGAAAPLAAFGQRVDTGLPVASSTPAATPAIPSSAPAAPSVPSVAAPTTTAAPSAAASATTAVTAPEPRPAASDASASELAQMRRQLDEQRRQIDALQRALAAQQAQMGSLQRAVSTAALDAYRGAGNVPRDVYAQATGQPQPPAASPGQQQQPGQQQPGQQPSAQQPVGQAPQSSSTAPQVAPIFEQPGVLTPRGKLVLEPSLQYSYSSSNRLAVVGYTVIPAINIGLFDVREVKRNTWTGTLSARYGLSNRTEVEARIPYVYRHDDTISRPFGAGSGTDQLFSASGKDIGDIEVAGRHQLNDGGPNKPYYIGTLRFKTRTGRDPFEVLTDPSAISGPQAAGTTGLQRELPTGSGFYALQPGLTWLFPSDPAVFFGSVSYLYSFKRSNVVSNTTNGPSPIGSVQPGGIFGFNFGMGLSINDKASWSIGYDHASVGKTQVNGQAAPLAVRTQLGTLLLGYSYRLDAQRSLNLSLGMGVTRDAPDLTLTLRVPYSL